MSKRFPLVCIFCSVMFVMASTAMLQAAEKISRFQLIDKKGQLHIQEGKRRVLTYNYEDQLAKGVAKDRTRACYIHPVYGLDGEQLTQDFPADHPHHRGVSWMWPKVWVDGKRVDLWHIRGIRQHFHSWVEKKSDDKHATFTVKNSWKKDGKNVVRETVTVKVSASNKTDQVIDIKLKFESLTKSIKICGQTKKGYGGFSFRFAPREDIVITADGKKVKDSDLLPYHWVDRTDRTKGQEKRSGVAVFLHPDNPGYPSGWTIRRYGPVVASWPGLDTIELKQNETIHLKYRLVVHRGNVQQAKIAQKHQQYLKAIKKLNPQKH